jgi:hypothetical protein
MYLAEATGDDCAETIATIVLKARMFLANIGKRWQGKVEGDTKKPNESKNEWDFK